MARFDFKIFKNKYYSHPILYRAILQSGTSLAPSWGPITPEHAIQYSDLLFEKLECDQDMDKLTCLQDKEMSDILALTDLIEDASIWMPIRDNDFTSEPFIPGNPEDLLSSGQFNTEVDVIIGKHEKIPTLSFSST